MLVVLAAAPAAAELPEPVAARLRDSGIPAEAVGVVVTRLTDGASLVSHHPDRPRQPASTIKVLTAIVALDRLGPAWRGRTELLARGSLADGVLDGDLVLRGMGDVDFDWHAFERMLHVARQQGIREVRGDLVLDLSWFRPARTDVGLPPFDEAPEFRYNVIPDALLLNSYLMPLDIVSDGQGVRAASHMPIEGLAIGTRRMKVVERACDSWEDIWKLPEVSKRRDGIIAIELHGDFPAHCTASTALNLIDRVAFVDRLFRGLWRRHGGTFRGKAREGEAGADARLVAEHRSRSLGEIVRDVNKRSDNPVTRVVYLNIGATSEQRPEEPTARRADAEVREWAARRGIDTRGLVLDNGSGLSRAERMTPAQLAGVLRAALASEWAPEFLASLPIVSVDGAMRKRLNTSPAATRARIKTGTLRDTSTIAGYVKDESGREHVVVAMIDHPLANRYAARPVLDALIDWVARRRADDQRMRR